MPGDLLHGCEIGSAVQKIANGGASEVVGRAPLYPGLERQPTDQVEHGLVVHAAEEDGAALANRVNERSGVLAAVTEPGLHGQEPAVRQVHEPFLVSLAPHAQPAGLDVEVVAVQPDDLRAAQGRGIEEREDGSVSRSLWSASIADPEERPQLTALERTSGGQPLPRSASEGRWRSSGRRWAG